MVRDPDRLNSLSVDPLSRADSIITAEIINSRSTERKLQDALSQTRVALAAIIAFATAIAGVPLVRDGEVLNNVFPGRPIRAPLGNGARAAP